MLFSATFCALSVSVSLDTKLTASRVSLVWVINSGLSTCDSKISGPLVVETEEGRVSVSLHSVPVAASLPSDIVLGSDWLRLLQDKCPRLVSAILGSPARPALPHSPGKVIFFCLCLYS
ncbi:hypothetical protein R3P38DRAFT_2567314 [Favolaschia claudopus]|uniref:Secreted protein n=1 Tax=Favolaschia claudopus TaxID=2862362 RepID=A0AAV9Z391_9AGAR